MKKNIRNIKEYPFSEQDRFFFDTNIWFYAVGRLENPDSYARIYAEAIKNIFTVNCQIFIDTVVFSEFMNRYARDLAQQQFGITRDKYKDFRDSKNFKHVAKQVAAAANIVLEHATTITTKFSNNELTEILHDFATKKRDINDQLIEKICITHDLTLITHDTDFREAKCRILTANAGMK